jgi:hypothetical protein
MPREKPFDSRFRPARLHLRVRSPRTGWYGALLAHPPHGCGLVCTPEKAQLHGMGPWGITYLNPADDPRSKASAK